MVHTTGESLLVQSACEVVDAKGQKETAHTLRELWKSTAALRTVLDRNKSINDLELLLLENHFHVLQMT